MRFELEAKEAEEMRERTSPIAAVADAMWAAKLPASRAAKRRTTMDPDRHCAACTGLYLGYISICPLHKAAPQLLEALKAILPEGWGDDDTMDHHHGVKLAREAIAKAEGRDA